jgi:putative ABC transport system substrate-binding protein
MTRREFISLLGGAAAAWPLAARPQQPAMPVIRFSRRRCARQLRALSGRFPLGPSYGGHPIKVGRREIIREHIRTL